MDSRQRQQAPCCWIHACLWDYSSTPNTTLVIPIRVHMHTQDQGVHTPKTRRRAAAVRAPRVTSAQGPPMPKKAPELASAGESVIP